MTIYLGTNLLAGSFKSGASWEVGDIGQSALGINESLNKRRYLNGQVISQAQFVQFTAMLKSRVSVYPSLAITEVNWQAEVTNSKLGQCGKFVIDDVAGTIRLPKVVNINGLQNLTALGGIKAESLPNITGDIGQGFSVVWDGQSGDMHGAFKKGGNGQNRYGNLGGGSGSGSTLEFDASLSSSTYQNSAPVQQEAVQYPYFIQVAEGVETSIDVSREIELNNPFSLLDYKYSEYELSNASWLLSNGQYNSGATYPAVYDLLLQIYNGTVTKAGVSVKLSTETYADTDFVVNTGDTTFRLPLKVKLPNSSMYLYFYVGETIQDANIIAAASVLTKVANSIDRTVESDRETVIGWGMPDYSAGIDITSYNSANNKFTAPCDGIITVAYLTTNTAGLPYINDIQFGNYNASAIVDHITQPINKGNTFFCTGIHNQAGSGCNKFYPLKGVN